MSDLGTACCWSAPAKFLGTVVGQQGGSQLFMDILASRAEGPPAGHEVCPCNWSAAFIMGGARCEEERLCGAWDEKEWSLKFVGALAPLKRRSQSGQDIGAGLDPSAILKEAQGKRIREKGQKRGATTEATQTHLEDLRKKPEKWEGGK